MSPKKKSSGRTRKPPPQRTSFCWRHKSLLIVLGVGILVRILCDYALSTSLFFGNYLLDTLAYHSWALDILNGQTADSVFFRAPLYPYTVAVLYRVFGVTPWAVVLFQNVLGLLTALVSYHFARDLIGSKAAFWTALVVAVYPTLIFFEGETLMTSLTVFLYTLAVYRVYRAAGSPSVGTVLTAGLALGLAAVTRPLILPMFLLLPIGMLVKSGLRSWRKILMPTLVILCGMGVPILPVTITNFVKGGEFVLISTQGGANFYIGNSAEADGITVVAPGPQKRIGKYNDNVWTSSVDEAELRTGRELSQSEVSSFWYSEAVDEILADPARAIGLYLKKFYFFWHGQEIFNNRSLYYPHYSVYLSATLWKHRLNFPTGLLFPLMFLGLFYAMRNGLTVGVPGLYLLMTAALVAAFFVCSRFRQPVVPIAIMFAVYGVTSLINTYCNHPRKAVVPIGVVLLLVVGLNLGGNIESRLNLSQFHSYLASSYHNRSEYDRAIEYYEKALTFSGENMSIYENLAKAYTKAGRTDEAERVYLLGLDKYPDYPAYNFGLGRILQEKGDTSRAAEYFKITVANAPDFPLAYDRLGYIYDTRQKYDSALIYYRRLYEIFPKPALADKIDYLESMLGE